MNTGHRPVRADDRPWNKLRAAMSVDKYSGHEAYSLLAKQVLSNTRSTFCELWMSSGTVASWQRLAVEGSPVDGGPDHRTALERLVHACAETGLPQLWKEPAGRPRAQSEEGYWAALALPVAWEDGAQAVMVLGRAGAGFSGAEVAACQDMADLAGLVLWAERVERRAQETERRLQALYEAAQILSSTLDIDTILSRLGDVLERTFNYPYFAILLVDDEGYLVVRAAQGYQDALGMRIAFGQGITGLAAKTGRPVVENDVTHNPAYIRGLPGARAEMAVPVHLRGDVAGVINVESRDQTFTGEDVALLASLADLVAIALDNARLFGETRAMAMTDGLTGLVNYRYFRKYLQEAIEAARLVPEPVSLLMIDLDNFKHVNDRLGHQAGDRVLTEFAGLIREHVRRSDTAARVGGDEFAIICRGTAREGAAALGARLEAAIVERTFGPYGDMAVRLSASMGVAAFPADADSFEELWQRADAAMYQGKKDGGSVVRVYSSS